MSVYKKFLFTIMLALSIGLFIFSSSSKALQNNDKTSPWVMDIPSSPEQLAANTTRAKIVVFRLQRPNDNYYLLPLNIFINRSYHSSLYPEHQAVALSLCPGKSTVQVAPGGNRTRLATNGGSGEVATSDLQAGIIYYYQITFDDGGKPVGRWVNAEHARMVLENMNVQTHTVSRVSEKDKCPASIYTLNASALFHLAKYDVQGLLPGAEKNLQNLTRQITDDFKIITKIAVKGYADPMGAERDNLNLSQLRAKTVAEKLIAAGLPDEHLVIQGMGSTSLIINSCKDLKDRRAVIQCNQPNRRVEVEVYGIKSNGVH